MGFDRLLVLFGICSQIVVCLVIDDVIVSTAYGRVLGKRITHFYEFEKGSFTNTIDTFLGIPYAEPPTGDYRFAAPRTLKPWRTPLNATTFSSVCPQMDIFHPDTAALFQSEDCLFLDIYVPYKEMEKGANYPVMVFIHGGSYEVGAGKLYNGEVLAMMGVVVVTINYRLGALGFLSSGEDDLSGNYGIQDQIAALEWIQENIHSFHGDRSKVTIFGHSAGGASVGILLTVPRAQGLFHGAIAQSGSATASYSYHHKHVSFDWYIRKVAEVFDCHSENVQEITKCLRQKHHQDFIAKRAHFPWFDPIDPEFRPSVDGQLIPDSPRDLFKKGQFHKVPFMLGTVKEEFDNYFNGGARHKAAYDIALDRYLQKYMRYSPAMTDIVRYEYTDWKKVRSSQDKEDHYDRGALLSDMHMVAPTVDLANLVSEHHPDVYQYHFSVHNSYHSVELNYVFGAPFSGKCADEMSSTECKNFTDQDRRQSELVMNMWTNFARYGNPTPKVAESQLPFPWDRYSSNRRAYLHLSIHSPRMRNHLRADKVAFWNLLIPRLLNGTYIPPSVDLRHYQTKMWTFLGIAGTLLLGVVFLLYLFIKTKINEVQLQQVFIRRPQGV